MARHKSSKTSSKQLKTTPVPPKPNDTPQQSSDVEISQAKIKFPTTVKPSTSRRGTGGGSLRSLSEKFDVDANSGTFNFSLPILTSDGRDAEGLGLNLSYNSGNGNGPFGVGWHLSTDKFERKTSKRLPTYTEDDIFVFAGKDLVPVFVNGVPDYQARTADGKNYRVLRFQNEVVESNEYIEFWSSTEKQQETWWKVLSPDNSLTIYGKDDNSRISAGQSEITRTFSWLPCQSFDAFGNAVKYIYKAENADMLDHVSQELGTCEVDRDDDCRERARYLKAIKYGNRTPCRDPVSWDPIDLDVIKDWMFEVILDYGEHDEKTPTTSDRDKKWDMRSDPFSTYTSGFEIRQYRLCQRVLMFHHFSDELGIADYLVGSTTFSYATTSAASFMTAFTYTSHAWIEAESTYVSESLPSYNFTYTSPPDIDLATTGVLQNTEVRGLPGGDYLDAQWIDLEGEGASGLLLEYPSGTIAYQRNDSQWPSKVQLSEPIVLASQTGVAKEDGYYEDVDRNGEIDLVTLNQYGQPIGWYARSEGKWRVHQNFKQVPSVDMRHADTNRLDLTGDGLQDIITVGRENSTLTWHESLSRTGFSAARDVSVASIAKIVESGSTASEIYFADMSGDGLVDMVQVRNGSISYWPNLGYGRFGKKVFMHNSPWMDSNDTFDISRMRLIDMDGYGPTDIVYFPKCGGMNIFSNHSGNSWADARKYAFFPRIDDLSQVSTIDIFGNGTSCLCWVGPDPSNKTDRVLMYIDIFNGQKPHMLSGFTNGSGKRVSLTYQPSTFFSRKDFQEGTPWKTKMPSPIQCVQEIRVEDLITKNITATRYSYHDGEYDRDEGEFSGFRMVEQWDALTFMAGKATQFQRPPTHTKTWFHTTAPVLNTELDMSFNDGSTKQLLICGDLTEADRVRAAKALRGKTIRVEVFADDGSKTENVPYTSKQWLYETVLIQQRHGKTNPVFRLVVRDIQQCHLERKKTDFRRSRESILEQNEYGQTCKRISVAFGRERSDLTRPSDQRQQTESVIVYEETDYTNPIKKAEAGMWREPQIAATRKYRLCGISVDQNALFNDHKSVVQKAIARLETIAAEDPKELLGKPGKVLLNEMKHYYRSQDLQDRLHLREIEPLSILDRSYEVAYDKNTTFLSAPKDIPALGELSFTPTELGYEVHDGDERWWRGGVQQRFAEDPVNELASARKNFYQPTISTDALGRKSTTKFDSYLLHKVEERDPLSNLTTTDWDYRVLKPTEITDPNGNRLQKAYDILGNATATAFAGKESEDIGDNLDGLNPFLRLSDLHDFLDTPIQKAPLFLKNASVRTIFNVRDIYSADDELKSRSPVFSAEIRRNEHVNPSAEVEDISITIHYYDGSFNVVQQVDLVDSPEAEAPAKWLISGLKVKDNKGAIVREYRSFFANSHQYVVAPTNGGVKRTHLLDPLGREVATLAADHKVTKTIYSSWDTTSYDNGDLVMVNDMSTDPDVGPIFGQLPRDDYFPSWYNQVFIYDSDPRLSSTLEKSAKFDNTPTKLSIDPLGKTICTIADIGGLNSITSNEYDLKGRKFRVVDALGRAVETTYHDMLGRPTSTDALDSGSSNVIMDALDQTVLAWNQRRVFTRTLYDKLGRTEKVFQAEGSEEFALAIACEYGESVKNAAQRNLLGQLTRVGDQSGMSQFRSYDFKGNCVESVRKLAKDFKTRIDWQSEVELEAETFPTYQVFDARNRIKEFRNPLGDVTRTTYNKIGQQVSVHWKGSHSGDWTKFRKGTEYNADGQCTLTTGENGVRREATYDPVNGMLTEQKTSRSDGSVLEHKCYYYDVYSRMSFVRDKAQKPIFFRNNQIHSINDYTYDGLGRLIFAVGREQLDSNEQGRSFRSARTVSGQSTANSANPQALHQYTETYEYDLTDRILSIKHNSLQDATVQQWDRKYFYEASSNRLLYTQIGGATEQYSYEGRQGATGCMTSLPGLSRLSWNYEDKLKFSATQNQSLGTPEITYYVYDYTGTRVRKVTERSTNGSLQTMRLRDTIYLESAQILRQFQGDGVTKSLEKFTSQVSGAGLIALVENSALGQTPVRDLHRYHFGGGYELDDEGMLISWLEYSPYGLLTYVACRRDIEAPSIYRFSSYEQDSETGLYCVQARYYVAWLGRWLSPDPLGIEDGLERYTYCGSDPINFEDPGGTMRKTKAFDAPSGSNDLPAVRRNALNNNFLGNPQGYRQPIRVQYANTENSNELPDINQGGRGRQNSRARDPSRDRARDQSQGQSINQSFQAPEQQSILKKNSRYSSVPKNREPFEGFAEQHAALGRSALGMFKVGSKHVNDMKSDYMSVQNLLDKERIKESLKELGKALGQVSAQAGLPTVQQTVKDTYKGMATMEKQAKNIENFLQTTSHILKPTNILENNIYNTKKQAQDLKWGLQHSVNTEETQPNATIDLKGLKAASQLRERGKSVSFMNLNK